MVIENQEVMAFLTTGILFILFVMAILVTKKQERDGMWGERGVV